MNYDDVLSPLALHDEALFMSLYGRADLLRFIGDVMPAGERQDYFRFLIDKVNSSSPSMWFWCIRCGGEKIGFIGLMQDGPYPSNVEIGIVTRNFKRSLSITKKVSEKVISFAFNTLKAERVIAKISISNIPAIKLAERCGLIQQDSENFKDKDVGVWVIKNN